MLGPHGKESPRLIVEGIAKEIARRGFPAKTKTITVMSATGNVRRRAIAIPGRGAAVIDDNLNIVVASSNNPLPRLPAFKYESVEAAAESILRNLPLP